MTKLVPVTMALSALAATAMGLILGVGQEWSAINRGFRLFRTAMR